MLFINGNINSGKTTIGKLLEEKISNSIFIDVDYITNDYSYFQNSLTFPEYAELRFNTMLDYIKNIQDNKFYIFGYLFFEYRYKEILNLFGKNNFLFVTLCPPLDFLLKDKEARQLKDIERSKIEYFHKLGIHNFPNCGVSIDNSSYSAQETADMIKKILSL